MHVLKSGVATGNIADFLCWKSRCSLLTWSERLMACSNLKKPLQKCTARIWYCCTVVLSMYFSSGKTDTKDSACCSNKSTSYFICSVNWKIKRSLPLSNRQLSPWAQILISLLSFAKGADYALYGTAELFLKKHLWCSRSHLFFSMPVALIAISIA